MCTSFSQRLFGVVVGAALAGCGSGLTLPDDGSPARLQAVSGYGQEGTVGSRLDDPLVARLTDANGKPVSGVAVEFSFQGSTDGELDPASTVTDSEGYAAAQVRLGTSAGALTVEAWVASATQLSTTFDLTALARGKGRGGGHDGDGDDDD